MSASKIVVCQCVCLFDLCTSRVVQRPGWQPVERNGAQQHGKHNQPHLPVRAGYGVAVVIVQVALVVLGWCVCNHAADSSVASMLVRDGGGRAVVMLR